MSTSHFVGYGPHSFGAASSAEEIGKELDALRDRLDGAGATSIGFPGTADFDYTPLAPFFAKYAFNNLGDPYSDGAYPRHTKPMEREVVDVVADLFQAPAGDRWGYVAGGATEGTEYSLHLATTLHRDAIVYHSAAAHHSVTNVIQRLGLMSIPIRADALGEIDYDDLADQVNLHRSRAAVVVANIGTAVTEAVDDVSRIIGVLDRLAVRRRWVHADAALSGIPLALLDPDDRPAFDFAAGTDSIVTSGHKFLGAPVPCAVVVVRNSHRLAHAGTVTYTGSADHTVANSRNGLAPLILWYALRIHGIDGLRARAARSRQLAAAAHDALREIGWPAHRHKHAMTVSFPTPPAAVTNKWTLATHGATSLLVCMPGITADQVDTFVADLKAAITPADVAPGRSSGPTAASSPVAVVSPATNVPRTGPAGDGPAGNGSAVNGSAVNGSAVNGSAVNGSAVNGSAGNGSAVNGSAVNGSAVNGSAVERPRGAAGVRAAAAPPSPGQAPEPGSGATGLWVSDPIEESLAPMPSLAEDPLAAVAPAPMPAMAGAALVAPPVPAPAGSLPAPAPVAAAAPRVASAGPPAAGPSDGVMPDLYPAGDHRVDASPPVGAAPGPPGALLPTPPQSLQRQKMLRRAGMPIRL